MKLELSVGRDRFLLGESISVDIRLKNTGAQAVEVPKLKNVQNTQPVYRLEGPSYPKGVTFSLRDVKLAGDPAALRAKDEPSTYRLAAGDEMETGFDLGQLKPIHQPGEYAISAKIDWNGWSVEAAPVKFRVEKAEFLEASLGIDVATASTRTLRAVWIAESPTGRMLGESFFYENRPDLGEFQLTGTRIIRAIGPTASNAFCPWVNFDRMSSPKFWHGWQEGTVLAAFSDDESAPRTYDLGSKKVQIVRPTLMSRSGDLDVLVLGANRKTLQMVRFLPGDTKSKPAAAWTIDLPEESVAIALGIGPEAEGGSRVAASFSQTGSKMEVRLIRIGDHSAELSAPLSFANAFALPNQEPSVSIAPDGTVHASVLFARHPLLRSLTVADVTAPRNGEASVAISDVGRAAAPVLQGWTAQSVSEGPPARRWLIRMENGTAGGGSGPTPVPAVAGALVVDFLRMSVSTYVLALDPDHGPRLALAGF